MIVFGSGGIVLPGEQQTAAQVPAIGKFIVDGESEGTSCLFSGYRIDGSEIGGPQEAKFEGSVDMEAAFPGNGLAGD